MIPASIVRFLDRANVAHAGTRDADLVPHGHRISGWRVAPDARRMTVFIPATSVEQLVASLEHNGQIAVTAEEYPAHEAYQFKGRYVAHRAVTSADLDTAAQVRDRFYRALKAFSPPEAEPVMRAFTQVPSIAVDFDVQEIFVQTPGPGAGARLAPGPA